MKSQDTRIHGEVQLRDCMSRANRNLLPAASFMLCIARASHAMPLDGGSTAPSVLLTSLRD